MIALRRSVVSKFCASLFVVLIVLPFTAPFRAWDSAPVGKLATGDLKTADDLSNSAGVAADTAATGPIAASGPGFVHGRSPDDRAILPRVLHPVLRL